MRFSELLGRDDDDPGSRRSRRGLVGSDAPAALADPDVTRDEPDVEWIPEEPLEPTNEWLRELGGLASTSSDDEPSPDVVGADADAASGAAVVDEPKPPANRADFTPVNDTLLPRGRTRRSSR